MSEQLAKQIQLSNIDHNSNILLYVTDIKINELGIDKSNSKIKSLTNINPYFGLSESFYRQLLDSVLSNPLQNVSNLVDTLASIKQKLLYTGLFSSITIDLDLSEKTKNVPNNSFGSSIKPLPLTAMISLTPFPHNKFQSTSSTSSSDNSLLTQYNIFNSLGQAENIGFNAGVNLNNDYKLDEKQAGLSIIYPLPSNPSFKSVLASNFTDIKKNKNFQPATHNQFSTSIGVQKNWANNVCPVLYNGLSFVRRDDKSSNAFLKTAFVSSLILDNRKFFNSFPTNGFKLEINNELTLSQSDKNTFKKLNNFNKLNFQAEIHSPIITSQNRITASLLGQFDLIHVLHDPNSDGTDIPSIDCIHNMDMLYLNGLKGFKPNLQSKYGLYSLKGLLSYKFPYTKITSPLRFQVFGHVGNVFNNWHDATQLPAFSAGFSLIYQSSIAALDLSYSIPLSNRPQDIAEPGFSFGCALSFF
ncbi:uncharacterized protein SCODWIG_03038 [Saccharomycodes ludwigii]|uniref:Bacterial surface antigen (D15) domain-containing protein n=1 Tax=Saccharomycodes ludwigii TaxID=36035 RepID=A0A376B9E6_9ASCO|nr:hypothetical protein SCDLUD_003219 [Saccharomycodes ludwigii]KAH3900247.1 hypothetical protein SCDLUD_003219 [Saccharomycodes ludwigii]SSD61277.1 uncharacterized protein SCODWIG_03038 [Saccharomycodes ludwigii]